MKTTTNKIAVYEKAKALFFKNHTQKEVSEITGISEQSICKWSKVWKTEKQDIELAKRVIIEKMQTMLTKENAKPKDLKNLVKTIEILNKV